MSKIIFRKEALSQLETPDHIDEAVGLIKPRMWFSLLGLVIVVAAVVAWAFLGKIPIQVEGYGVFYYKGKLSEIVAEQPGVLREVVVKNGQPVEKEQVLAILSVSCFDHKNKFCADGLEKYEIKAPYAGVVYKISAFPINRIAAGELIMLLSPFGINKRDLHGVAFTSLLDGKKIKTGMRALLDVSTANMQTNGYMLGRVAAVSETPASTKEILSLVKEPELANLIHNKLQASPINLNILPELTSLQNANGYRWSLNEPERETEPGTVFKVKITVAQRRPIDFVSPFFERLF